MPDCHRCHAQIIPGQASRRKEEVREIVSSDGKRETHYSKELICRSCANWERWVIAGKAAFFALVAVVWLLKITDLFSLEARSQETSAVYQNPDFPCVTAIDPTVTDLACVTAIAPKVTAPKPRPILIPPGQ